MYSCGFCRRLTKLAHVPEMEGQRAMTVFFLCVPLGILVGLVIGITVSILVRRQGSVGFLIALAWSLLIVCGIAGLVGGVPYLLSDKPPQIDGRRLKLEFELRAPATLKIPEQPDGYSIRVSLYTDTRQSDFAFKDWNESRRTPSMLRFRVMSGFSHTAKTDLFSRRSATSQPRRNSLT